MKDIYPAHKQENEKSFEKIYRHCGFICIYDMKEPHGLLGDDGDNNKDELSGEEQEDDTKEDEYLLNKDRNKNNEYGNTDLRDSMALEMVSILSRNSQKISTKLNENLSGLIEEEIFGDDTDDGNSDTEQP